MIRVGFVAPDGSVAEAQGEAGDTVLRVGQAIGQPLEGTCEGQMACATCHVVVDPAWADRLPGPSVEEEDMLDLAPRATRTSRLSCQIRLDATLDGLVVRLP